MNAIEKELKEKKQRQGQKDAGKIQDLGLDRRLQVAKEENSNQASLSTDLTNHLLNLSKEVTRNEINPETVKAACNCAQQIHNMIRLQMKIAGY